MRRLWLIGIVAVCVCACAPGGQCGGQPSQRVLFVGNSYTYVNDLPGTFAALACSGGDRIETGMAAQGGWTLALHQTSDDTAKALKNGHWDDIVLQEQSEIPALAGVRGTEMVPPARQLVGRVRALGAKPVFFLTWAHRDGMPDSGYKDYASMQFAISTGYLTLAKELDVTVAPVGEAWHAAQGKSPPLDLWLDDGSHPNPKGTYLAACVFYAVITGRSPVGLSYTGGLSAGEAAELQALAADTVFKTPSEWHLPK